MHIIAIIKGITHSVVSAKEIRDRLVVTQHLLALERNTLTTNHLTGSITKLRSDNYHSLLVHILLREVAIDCHRHLSTQKLKRLWIYGEIICRKRTKLL